MHHERGVEHTAVEENARLCFALFSRQLIRPDNAVEGTAVDREIGIEQLQRQRHCLNREVEERLIEQIAATQNVSEANDWHQWYLKQYGKHANYSELLGEMVKTSTERVRLMQKFFEPTTEEKDLGWKLPTKAHKAIANLIKEGYVKVVITTNFDRLLENALEEIGVHPQIIKNESDWETATPIIHSKEPTIIKVNGDYLDCQFRNTTEELDDYPQILE